MKQRKFDTDLATEPAYLREYAIPGGCLREKKKALEEEYHKTYDEIKEKIGFELTDRFATLKGVLSSLEADFIYFQGLKDGARLYRMLTEE